MKLHIAETQEIKKAAVFLFNSTSEEHDFAFDKVINELETRMDEDEFEAFCLGLDN